MAFIKIIKQKEIKSKAIPPDIENNIKAHNCITQPEYFYSLAEFADFNSYHQRCLNVKANCVAGLGYKVTNPDAKKVMEFLKNPNANETFDELVTKLWYDYELYGNMAIEIIRIGATIDAIYHLPFRDIYIQKDKQAYWQILPNWGEQKFASYGNPIDGLTEVLHYKRYTPKSSYYGLPEYLGALKAITINSVIAEYNLNFFSNSAIPDLMLIVEGGEFDEKTEKEVKDYLTNNLQGFENAHKTLYIPISDPNVKIRIEKLNEVKDGHFRYLRNDNRDEILSAHGVPPRLAGVVASGSLGGSGEAIGQLKNFLQIDIRPKQAKLEAFLNRFFMREFGEDPKIKFNELDLTTALEDAQLYQIYTQTGIMTIDEVRERLHLPPLDKATQNQTTEADSELLRSLKIIRRSYENALQHSVL